MSVVQTVVIARRSVVNFNYTSTALPLDLPRACKRKKRWQGASDVGETCRRAQPVRTMTRRAGSSMNTLRREIICTVAFGFA